MPQQYISHPSGTPAEKCMVYPLSPCTGAEAYTLYASASGVDKWKELFAKIEAESDALRGARGVYPTIVLADEHEERRRAYPPPDIYNESEQRYLREQFDQHERAHSSYYEFREKLDLWIASLQVWPEGLVPGVGPFYESTNIVSDKSLGDTVIAMITVLPLYIGMWWDTSD